MKALRNLEKRVARPRVDISKQPSGKIPRATRIELPTNIGASGFLLDWLSCADLNRNGEAWLINDRMI